MSPVDAGAEVRDDRDQAADQPLQVGEPIPAVCTIEDMCRIFRVGSRARSTGARGATSKSSSCAAAASTSGAATASRST
jgi:hypothetical protein